MPSRRRSRRALPHARHRLSRRKSTRPKKKLKKPQKPRLVRRYVRRKQGDSKSHAKHPNLRVSGQTDKSSKKSNQNPGLRGSAGYGSHDVAVDKKQTSEELTAVPNPIPDSGATAAAAQAAGSPLLGALADTPTSGLVVHSTTAVFLTFSKTPSASFSPLPPLPSLVVSNSPALPGNSGAYGSTAPFLPVETNPPSTSNDSQQSTGQKPHTVNLAVIILLAIGSVLLLLGTGILIRMCTRVKRSERPKPSLPIFNDADPEDNFFETKESPIFGGKERLSPMPGVGGPTWTWIQYPHSRLTQPPASQATQSLIDSNDPGQPSGTHATSQMATEPLHDTSTKQPHPIAPAASQHTTKRQSIASLYSPRLYANIGQAISHDRQETSFTADGHEAMKRGKSKNGPNRRSQLVREENNSRESTSSSIGLAYDGDDVGSPGRVGYLPMDKTPVPSSYEGRERIRSGYFAAGTYPRISTMPSTSYSIATATRINVGQRNSFSRDKFTLQRSNSKRQRDTQALTYALGLATPETNIPQSPQPTLYPDDSMSVVDAKRPRKRAAGERKPVESMPDVPVIVPEERMPPSSGLMSMDFGVSQMSLSGLTMGPVAEDEDQYFQAEPGPQLSTGASSPNPDKAPRVPSPPPLPSLAQMAFAQHNAEGYANYRSPTYSLYGLYEVPDRKSLAR